MKIVWKEWKEQNAFAGVDATLYDVATWMEIKFGVKANVWEKYSKKRIYVNDEYGMKVGFVGLENGKLNAHYQSNSPKYQLDENDVLYGAIDAFRDAHIA